MNDYLTGEQIARLEALKLLLPRVGREWSPAEIVDGADTLARFIIDGAVAADQSA